MPDSSVLMTTPEERREFVQRHRTCVFAFDRKQGPPSMSIVYYVCNGDDGSKLEHGLAARLPWR